MRRTRQAAPGKSVPLARFFAAAALVLCVLSGALPAEAVFNPGGPMACCRSKMGTGGEGVSSCPLCRRAKAKPRKPVRSEHACGADLALQKKGSDALAPHALLLKARLDERVQPEVEHGRGDGVSTRDATRSTSRQASVGGASLARPCPSDCCGTAASAPNGPRRPRHEAALTGGFRPRPPTDESYTYAPSGLTKATSVLRRSCPPRAPPSGLDARKA